MSAPNRPTTLRTKILNAIGYLALTAVGITMLLPFAWMISTSLKDPAHAIEFPPRWIPSEPTTVQIDGRACRVADVVGEKGVRVAVLRYSPEGVEAQVTAPPSLAGQRRTLPENRLRFVRGVKFHWENYRDAWQAEGIKVTGAFLGLVHQADGLLVFYLNSIFVSICVTIGVVFTSSSRPSPSPACASRAGILSSSVTSPPSWCRRSW